VEHREVLGGELRLVGDDLQARLGVRHDRAQDLDVTGVQRPAQGPAVHREERRAQGRVEGGLARVGVQRGQQVARGPDRVADQDPREQVELAREVEVHGALADTGAAGDVLDRHPAVAVGEQQLPRRVQHPCHPAHAGPPRDS